MNRKLNHLLNLMFSAFTKPGRISMLFVLFATMSVLFSCTTSKVTTHKNGNAAKLHTLWVSEETLHGWVGKGRLTLRFTFTHGTITLAGWFNKPQSEDFNHDPDVQLNVSNEKKKVTVDPIYLGNLRLTAGDIEKIDAHAKPGETILFIPVVISDDPLTMNNLRYDISISSDFKIESTGLTALAKADPSPPATR